MFKWLKRLFHRPRLIERYESLEAIIDAHNKLILKTNEVRDTLPPKYLLSRYNAIQDAEEKAIAAYWLNKNRKQDKWYKNEIAIESSAMTDIALETQPKEVTETAQPIEAQPPEELAAAPAEEVLPPDNRSNTQTLEQPKENVIEIHINK